MSPLVFSKKIDHLEIASTFYRAEENDTYTLTVSKRKNMIVVDAIGSPLPSITHNMRYKDMDR